MEGKIPITITSLSPLSNVSILTNITFKGRLSNDEEIGNEAKIARFLILITFPAIFVVGIIGNIPDVHCNAERITETFVNLLLHGYASCC